MKKTIKKKGMSNYEKKRTYFYCGIFGTKC